jgi:hypothetical protein
MKDEKARKPWWVATVIVAGLVCLTAAGISVWSVAQPRESQAKTTSVTIQWQPQSDLEARFHAKLVTDHKVLKKRLEKLAGEPVCPSPKAWQEFFKNHFLNNPRLWANGEWKEGWENIMLPLYNIVHKSEDIEVHFAWGMIEYVPYDKVKKPRPEDDVDFLVRIKVTFSASPGDNILEGTLRHRRICEIIP